MWDLYFHILHVLFEHINRTAESQGLVLIFLYLEILGEFYKWFFLTYGRCVGMRMWFFYWGMRGFGVWGWLVERAFFDNLDDCEDLGLGARFIWLVLFGSISIGFGTLGYGSVFRIIGVYPNFNRSFGSNGNKFLTDLKVRYFVVN